MQLVRWPSIAFTAMTLLSSSGCSTALRPEAEAIIRSGDNFHVMLLQDIDRAAPRQAVFHKYAVERDRAVVDPSTRALLQATLLDDLSAPTPLACRFSPRYGVRVVRGQRVLDFLFCFGCNECLAYWPDGSSSMFSVRPQARKVLASLIPEQIVVASQ